MINYYGDILEGRDVDSDVLKGLDASSMERLLMGCIPIHRISSTRVLIGTQIKTMSVRSDRIMIASGGGSVTIEDHWRTVAVGEMLRLNKILNNKPNLSMTEAIVSIISKDSDATKKSI